MHFFPNTIKSICALLAAMALFLTGCRSVGTESSGLASSSPSVDGDSPHTVAATYGSVTAAATESRITATGADGTGNPLPGTTSTRINGSSPSTTTSTRNYDGKTELNVRDYGADNTGATDNTALLQELHNTGKRIYYPKGVYLFNGLTLNLSGGVRFESMNGVIVRNNVSGMNILRFDAFGNLVGLMQNHLEVSENDSVRPKNGSLVRPPLSNKNYNTTVDLLPFWYNDFGLASQILAHNGWLGWYYWSWNHHDVKKRNPDRDPYDPSRHPWLGFYYGDDPVVLDWQCYWMKEYGINQVAILNSTLSNWEAPVSSDHWIYQLFHNTPNFKKMKYVAFADTRGSNGSSSDAAVNVRAAWMNVLEKMYAKHDNYYTIKNKSKTYPVVYLWDETSLKYVFGSTQNVVKFLLDMTKEFQNRGFDGLAIISRNSIGDLNNPPAFAVLEAQGLIRYSGTYVANYVPSTFLSGNINYSQVVDAFAPVSNAYDILGIATSMLTQTPHPSKWKCAGSTPAQFERWLKKAADHVTSAPERKKIVTCYNVAEWAEGGPGLQPNVKDGFGYLQAIKNAIVK